MSKCIILILFFSLTSFSCKQPAIIESNEAVGLLENDYYFFLDVRTLKEHNTKSIPNTACIPVQKIEQRIEEIFQYKDKKIIVYCRSGNRSEIATKILNQNGFDAYNMLGGMKEWKGEVTQKR